MVYTAPQCSHRQNSISNTTYEYHIDLANTMEESLSSIFQQMNSGEVGSCYQVKVKDKLNTKIYQIKTKQASPPPRVSIFKIVNAIL